ncbi:bifunctional helix-turn-helix domain-containing protein/methylated-DNA--[protein]-cysteine S-methyltransferase [uncultured Litoreibacter sp.]|uniref:bifunctional helix-turn-helix domain-containing protein/methylated-DNA--[protein]-cysteine S-methyltransferase n=1 Tax=uncultured Litoreibacter sp. TaxID=1392394 RepID=UPI00260A1C35|nr:bifunctional helix-turn-helix domain-containing protein/methylated-DNA--[protein]-cysteine S-methyltransferase [uncultured Litoreibacter sp.]
MEQNLEQITASEGSYHYGLVKRAIEAIDTHSDGPLSLDQLARDMKMSPSHFQRVFSKWAGVSPSRLQQYLRLGHAKTLLEERFTMLETSSSVGLSGSGRLHDLFVKWEAMSPGEFARKGEGLTIRWGWFDSPFGPAIVMGTTKGICGIGFSAEIGETLAMEDLVQRWPHATFVEDPLMLRPWALAAFGAKAAGEAAPLYLIGAPFQIKVWEALLAVPNGHVVTYSEIANTIGHKKAVRAVGTAVGRNPISWLIPCHRALRKSGGLGGYHWGLPMKRAMLAYEAAKTSL